MSLNPHSTAHMASIAPTVPRGLTTCQFDAEDYPTIRADRRHELARIEDVDKVGACFISHEKKDLASPRVAELKRSGLPILCWTVRSSEEEALARKVADNVTFEGYLP